VAYATEHPFEFRWPSGTILNGNEGDLFEDRQKQIDRFNVETVLAKDEHKNIWITASCDLGEEVLSILYTHTGAT
jgi:hypothetical protein